LADYGDDRPPDLLMQARRAVEQVAPLSPAPHG
jgi:hypothetical protein